MADILEITIKKDEDTQVLLGHAGFIKTAEDLYEAMVNSVPKARFGIAFAEASGPCLIRIEGNDPELKKSAEENLKRVNAGHTFIILFKEAYPINVLPAIKDVREVTRVYCATANPLTVLVAMTSQGGSVIGVVDGSAPKGVESDEDILMRRKLLRDFGYKK